MGDRLKDKVAIVVGAGQTPGETIGNGRATAMVYAREGAKVLLVDRRLESAQDTQGMIEQEGGTASAFAADRDQRSRLPENGGKPASNAMAASTSCITTSALVTATRVWTNMQEDTGTAFSAST